MSTSRRNSEEYSIEKMHKLHKQVMMIAKQHGITSHELLAYFISTILETCMRQNRSAEDVERLCGEMIFRYKEKLPS